MPVSTAPATKDLAASIAAWAISAAPQLQEAYDSQPADRGPLPDAAILIGRSQIIGSDVRWPARGHSLLRTFQVGVLIVVDPDPVDQATDTLTDIGDALTLSILADRTLGGRVPAPGASYLTQFDDQGDASYSDGTLGRVGTLTMAVAAYLEVTR